MKSFNFLITLIFLTFSNTIYSQERKEWKFSIGPAVVLKNNLRLNNTYSNMDRSFTYRFIPFVDGRYNRLSLGQNGISLRVLGDFAVHANVFVNYTGDKYHSDFMEKRRGSAFLGFHFKYHRSQASISRDIQSRSKGMEYKYSYSQLFFLSENWTLINSYGVSYHDNKYANYYYGVRDNEVTATRKAYTAKGYFTPSVGFLPIYKFSEHFTATIGTFFKYIPQKISSSPTMKGRQLEVSTIWGITYNL